MRTIYDTDYLEYGQWMTRRDFRESCALSSYNDEDGYALGVIGDFVDESRNISPSEWRNIPKEMNHILWFGC